MAVAPKIITNSVVLKPGEQFTLPPGAKLIASSNSTALSSTCDIPPLQSFGCYVGLIAAAGEEGSVSQYFEADSLHVIGYRLNKVEYMFSEAYKADDNGSLNRAALANEMKVKMGGMIQSFEHDASGNDERGMINYILIRTVESVGDNLEFIIQSVIAGQNEGDNQTIRVLSPFYKYEDIAGLGYRNLPPCDSEV